MLITIKPGYNSFLKLVVSIKENDISTNAYLYYIMVIPEFSKRGMTMPRLIIIIIIFISSFFTFAADFIKGADVSWVPGQETNGVVFRDSSGVQRDILDILKKDYQMNTIRLRVFVNPSDDWGNGLCDISRTVAMAKRVKNAGMQLMLTLHYSDSWADPGKQNPPAAWKNFTQVQLESAVYNHTKEIMTALAAEGISPVMVQIGNETNNGMLWPTGDASKNMKSYANLVSAGHNAVKEISPETKTVVHLSNGFDNSLFRWNIGGLTNNKASFDAIGMSAYPEYAPNTSAKDWQAFNNKVLNNVKDMITSYKKPVIIAETGMDYREENNCRSMIADMIAKIRAIKDQMGLGVIYWEPQAGPGYNRGYNLGAWGANGRPTKAINGFVENVTSSKDQMLKGQAPNSAIKTRYINGFTVISLPNDFSGSTITLYSTDGKMVYRNPFTKEFRCRLSKGTYVLYSHYKGLGQAYKIPCY